MRNTNLRKKLRSFSIENIDDPCLVTIAVNPKKYFGQFESDSVNKNHKGLRKSALGMEFENYSRRINFVKEIEIFGQVVNEKHSQF